jgi:peroxiredoxin
MTFRRPLLSLLAVTLLGMLAYYWLAPEGPKTRPDIGLITIDGEELRLNSLQGRPVLVTFWATTCNSCVKEIPHLVELYDDLAPQGLEVIGIAMGYDPPNRVLAMRRARNIPYPIALDIHADAARAFGNVRLTPTSFLIAPDGRIVYRKTGTLDMSRLREKIRGMLGAT